MTTLEKILQEIEERKEKCLSVVKIEVDPMEIAIHREQYKGLRMAEDIIKKHQSCENHDETTRQSRDNDGWIPVEERLPEDDDFVLVTVTGIYNALTFSSAIQLASYCKDDGWFIEGYPDWENPNVSARRPLPEPYHPERSRE